MDKLIIDLTDKDALSPSVAGGKGANLARLKQGGFNVPDGVILTVDFFYEIIVKIWGGDFLKRLQIGNISREEVGSLIEQINRYSLFSDFPYKNELIKKVKDFGTFVVRSSFTGEDSEVFSFAGLGESVVAIEDVEELTDAIKKVYRSFFSPKVFQYYRINSLNVTPGAAVIIQKFVPGEFSGVLFTDLNGDMVVEYLPGTAIPIVQGVRQPVRYIINKKTGKVLKKEFPGTLKGLVYKRGEGLVEKNFSSSLLPGKITKELVVIGKKIAGFFGSPRDVEWTYCCGKIYILQARAITHSVEENYHWSRILGEEFWSGRVSPMMYSLVGKAIEEAMIKKPIRALLGNNNPLINAPAIGLFYNHIYINLDLLKEVFKIIPRWALTDQLLKMFPPNMVAEIKQNSRFLPLKLPVAMLRFLTAGLPWAFHKNYKLFKQFVEKDIPRIVSITPLEDMEENIKLLKLIYEELKNFLEIVVWGVTYAYISVPLAQQLFSLMVGDMAGKAYSHILFSNLKGDLNTQFLEELSLLAQKMPFEWKKIKKLEELELLKNKYPEFNNQFEQFVEKYGHRSEERDLNVPRWEENPLIVVKILASSGQSRFEEVGVMETWQKVKKLLIKDRVKINYTYFPVFYLFLWLSRTYLTLRENMRFYADIYLLKMRKILLKIGKVLVDNGFIERPSDVFFLRLEELEEQITQRNLVDLIRERRESFDKDAEPPDYIVGGKPLEIPAGNFEHLVGETISPGVASGRVRIVKKLEDFLLVDKGEIVVMSNLDPSWSSLVGKVAGAVFEVGGLLSHGAIIAREFKIPAIAGVRDATKKLKTGDMVVLDATAGTVTKIS